MHHIKIVLLTLFFVANLYSPAQNSEIKTEPVPDWVDMAQADLEALPVKSEMFGGFYYLLLEKQFNREKESRFIHRVIKILDNEGVQQMSDISVEFDPAYATLNFHSIIVHRNGETINKLADHSINTIQRESDMERKLYDGHLTAYVNLRDIRQGDILEFAYSISGSNPFYEGHFNFYGFLEQEVPVERIIIRIQTNDDADLNFSYLNGAPQPKINRIAGHTNYTWDLHKVKALLLENNIPYWYSPFKYIVVSDFASWSELVELIRKQYQVPEDEKERLHSKTKNLFTSGTLEERIVEAIRFVQDEVRYLGFETGLSSLKPHSPLQVFDQRFGDCKDKTLLLQTLLGNMGVEAYPVLVDINQAYQIENEAPSLFSFNHVVLQIIVDNTKYYVDPTLSSQGGALETIYFPYYRKGLVIKKGEAGLTDLPESNHSYTWISEKFTLDEIGGNATLKIVTDYFGRYADWQRAWFNNNSIDFLTQSYTEYYSHIYLEIEPIDDVTFLDERGENNVFTTTEHYAIQNFWEEDPDNSEVLYCEFLPMMINAEIPLTASARRTMPFAINHPTNITQQTIIQLPEPWLLSMTPYTIETDEIYYDYNIIYANQEIILDHTYKTFTDHVLPENFRKFRKKIEKITDDITLQLTYNQDYEIEEGDAQTSFFAVIVTLITSLAAIFLFLKVYRKYDPPPKNTVNNYSRPIGGWLVLIAIGLIITPFILMYSIFWGNDFFLESIWTTFSDPDSSLFNPSLLALLTFELVYNVALFFFAILLLILFFKRRTSIPLLMVIYFAVSLLVLAVDTLLSYGLAGEFYTAEETQTAIIEVFRSLIVAAIWIPYFLVSDRVKDTFVVRYRKDEDQLLPGSKTEKTM